MDREMLLFTREGHLIYATLASGLTSLRRATVATKGDFYVAFFNISTALERMMKLIIILNWRKEGKQIDKSRLRRLGHDLVTLFQETEQVAEKIGKREVFHEVYPQSIPWKMLVVLSEFARTARYANIDALLNGQVEFHDPLDRWHKEVSVPIFETLPDSTRQKIVKSSSQIAELLLSSTGVLMDDFSGDLMDLPTLTLLSFAYKAISPYAVWYATRIVFPLAELIVGFNYFMGDFFADFSLRDKDRIMRKVRWP